MRNISRRAAAGSYSATFSVTRRKGCRRSCMVPPIISLLLALALLPLCTSSHLALHHRHGTGRLLQSSTDDGGDNTPINSINNAPSSAPAPSPAVTATPQVIWSDVPTSCQAGQICLGSFSYSSEEERALFSPMLAAVEVLNMTGTVMDVVAYHTESPSWTWHAPSLFPSGRYRFVYKTEEEKGGFVLLSPPFEVAGKRDICSPEVFSPRTVENVEPLRVTAPQAGVISSDAKTIAVSLAWIDDSHGGGTDVLSIKADLLKGLSKKELVKSYDLDANLTDGSLTMPEGLSPGLYYVGVKYSLARDGSQSTRTALSEAFFIGTPSDCSGSSTIDGDNNQKDPQPSMGPGADTGGNNSISSGGLSSTTVAVIASIGALIGIALLLFLAVRVYRGKRMALEVQSPEMDEPKGDWKDNLTSSTLRPNSSQGFLRGLSAPVSSSSPTSCPKADGPTLSSMESGTSMEKSDAERVVPPLLLRPSVSLLQAEPKEQETSANIRRDLGQLGTAKKEEETLEKGITVGLDDEASPPSAALCMRCRKVAESQDDRFCRSCGSRLLTVVVTSSFVAAGGEEGEEDHDDEETLDGNNYLVSPNGTDHSSSPHFSGAFSSGDHGSSFPGRRTAGSGIGRFSLRGKDDEEDELWRRP